MGYYRGNRSRLGQAAPVTVAPTNIPASVGGVNSLDSIANMPPQDCIYTYNLMPVEYGLRLRRGYREWATGATGDVRTIIPYEGITSGGATDKLFAATENGIYEVSLFGTTAPTEEVSFTLQGEAAGTGVYCEFTNDASEHYLFYADGLNGLWQYTEAGGWAAVVGGTNPGEWQYDPGGGAVAFPVEDVAFVTVHKLRIWVILEDSQDAYYLPLAAVGGTLTKFTFGSKMPSGGRLMGLWTWTIDGGDGVDDYFVGIGRAGDVVVYRGDDPEAIDPAYTANGTWAIVGTWFIGKTPASRRLSLMHGGEMYMLSTYGITSIRDLLEGTVANEMRRSPSAKVNRFLRRDVELGVESYTWQLAAYPADGFMQVVTPEPASTPYVQYNQNLATKAWGFWENVPALCADHWNGQYMMGAKDGVVYIYDGVVDGSTLDGSIPGEPISYRTLTSFQPLGGNHSSFKRAGIIRTMGVLQGSTAVNVQAVYDYDVATTLSPPATLPSGGEDVWDSAVWNAALWDAETTGENIPIGALGVGRVMAVGLTGSADNRINIVAFDILFTEGGLM